MKDTYFTSDEKTSLAIRTAVHERELLKTLNYENGYSLYIGIPFCPTTCLYCSFTSFPIASWKKKIGDYLDALEKEIDFVAESCGDKILDTVYIGGGTPTVDIDELCETLDLARDTWISRKWPRRRTRTT